MAVIGPLETMDGIILNGSGGKKTHQNKWIMSSQMCGVFEVAT